LNEVFYFSRQYFSGDLGFVEFSKSIAKFLYEVTEHPKIKSGELYVVALDNVQLEGEEHKAIGIFKSENKEAYLKVYTEASGLGVNYEEKAININNSHLGLMPRYKDRKSTRLNSSHVKISYAVFCLKKK